MILVRPIARRSTIVDTSYEPSRVFYRHVLTCGHVAPLIRTDARKSRQCWQCAAGLPMPEAGGRIAPEWADADTRERLEVAAGFPPRAAHLTLPL